MQAGGYHEPPVVVAPKHRRPVVTQPKETVQQVELPFRMELKRSRKQRLEVDFNGKTSVQVYDGATGWLLRPYLNRNDYEPFTAEQAKAVSEEADLDGYLIDYAAKGTTVALVSTEKVGGRDNYKLKLTLKNGYSLHVWVDAQTYLETKMDGTPRRLDGEYRPVEVYLSDYRSVNGVMVPFQLETKVNYVPYGSRQPKTFSEKITIENVTVNRNLDDSAFTKPKSEVAAGAPQPLTPKSTSVSR
jgi:outer membrane lipoprotein-sorting protein